MVSNIDYQNVR